MTDDRQAKPPGWLTLTLLGVSIAAAATTAMGQSALPWMNTTLTPEKRAELLVGAMTLDQKVQQIALRSGPNPDLPTCLSPGQRHLAGIPELGIPVWRATNGPIGVATGDCSPSLPTTGLPTAIGVAASFDRQSATLWGDVAGKEVRAIGHHALWGPGLNLARNPQGGRNFEYFGEDPYLTGVMATLKTVAIQKSGVEATGKHFAANEQETSRQTLNVIADKRTLKELYLLPFEMAIKDGGMTSVMCSYPRLNGVYACDSKDLLTTMLRDEIGFKGYVISDRGAARTVKGGVNAGMDLELNSTPRVLTMPLVTASLAANEIQVSQIDTMLKNRLQVRFRNGQFDSPILGTQQIDWAGNGQAARYIARQSMTLLKNKDKILPLNPLATKNVAIIGPSDFSTVAKIPTTGPGGGSGAQPTYTFAPITGMQNVITSLGGSATVSVNTGTSLTTAVALAAASDVVIVMVGDNSVEGADRNLSLGVRNGVDQDALIAAVAAANPKTIVVLKNGGALLMPWLNSVPAVLAAWLPGQEDGLVVAETLYGVNNPSGKLPMTFPAAELEAGSATPSQFPGTTVTGTLTAVYSEGLKIGYRWYDATGTKPLFPFGFGLSYTTFLYSGVSADATKIDGTKPVTVKFRIKNTGSVQGAESAQVYATFDAKYNEPPKRLVGFDKKEMDPGEEREMSVTIDPNASNHPLSYWDVDTNSWKLMEGEIKFTVARASDAPEGSVKVSLEAPKAVVTPPATPAATNDESGGCTSVTNARFDPLLVVLALLAMLGVAMRRRSRK